MSHEVVAKLRFCRFLGLFEPMFDSFCGGNIRELILPPQKESNIGQKSSEKRRTLSSVTTSVALLFPGQGAQRVGMGKVWYDAYPVARQLFEEASDLMSLDLPRMIFHGSEHELSETRHSQPAIFVTSIAILRVVQQE